MEQGAVVKTSQAHLGKLIQQWKDLLEEYDEILYIPLSSGLSGSYQSALTASAAFDGRIIPSLTHALPVIRWLGSVNGHRPRFRLDTAVKKSKIKSKKKLIFGQR